MPINFCEGIYRDSPCVRCPGANDPRCCAPGITVNFSRRLLAENYYEHPTCRKFEFNFSNALAARIATREENDFYNAEGELIIRAMPKKILNPSEWFNCVVAPTTATVLVKNPLGIMHGKYGAQNALAVIYGVPFALSSDIDDPNIFNVVRPVVHEYRPPIFNAYWKYLEKYSL